MNIDQEKNTIELPPFRHANEPPRYQLFTPHSVKDYPSYNGTGPPVPVFKK